MLNFLDIGKKLSAEIGDSIWYLDNFENSKDLTASLWSIRSTSYKDATQELIGCIDGSPDMSIGHTWNDGKNGILALLESLFKGFKELVDAGESLGNQVRSMIGQPQQYSESFNTIISSNLDMISKYGGSNITIQIPSFTKYFIYDTSGNKPRARVNEFLQKFNLAGEYKQYELFNTLKPPNNYRYNDYYNPNTAIPGSFMLKAKRFTIRDLVMSNITIKSSDTSVIESSNSNADISEPSWIKVSIDFVFVRKPTPLTIQFALSDSIDFKMETGVPEGFEGLLPEELLSNSSEKTKE